MVEIGLYVGEEVDKDQEVDRDISDLISEFHQFENSVQATESRSNTSQEYGFRYRE